MNPVPADARHLSSKVEPTRRPEKPQKARRLHFTPEEPGFFRLAGLLHRWFIPLKPCVFMQGGAGRVAQVLLVGDPLVAGRAGISSAEKQDVVIGGAGQ